MAELAQRKVVGFQIESRTSLKSIVQEFRLQPTGIAKSTSFVNWICLIHRVLVVSLDVHPPTGRMAVTPIFAPLVRLTVRACRCISRS